MIWNCPTEDDTKQPQFPDHLQWCNCSFNSGDQFASIFATSEQIEKSIFFSNEIVRDVWGMVCDLPALYSMILCHGKNDFEDKQQRKIGDRYALRGLIVVDFISKQSGRVIRLRQQQWNRIGERKQMNSDLSDGWKIGEEIDYLKMSKLRSLSKHARRGMFLVLLRSEKFENMSVPFIRDGKTSHVCGLCFPNSTSKQKRRNLKSEQFGVEDSCHVRFGCCSERRSRFLVPLILSILVTYPRAVD